MDSLIEKPRIAFFDKEGIIAFHGYVPENMKQKDIDDIVKGFKFSKYQRLEFNQFAHVGTRVVSTVEQPEDKDTVWNHEKFSWIDK